MAWREERRGEEKRGEERRGEERRAGEDERRGEVCKCMMLTAAYWSPEAGAV
jgi:hypothetical protein